MERPLSFCFVLPRFLELNVYKTSSCCHVSVTVNIKWHLLSEELFAQLISALEAICQQKKKKKVMTGVRL